MAKMGITFVTMNLGTLHEQAVILGFANRVIAQGLVKARPA